VARQLNPNPRAGAYFVGFATTSMRPVKLRGKRRAKSLDAVMVPESGPGTYQAAKKSVRSKSSYGALMRYDVRVEGGLSIDPDKAAVLIQGVLDDPRRWRGTRCWRFVLTRVGQSANQRATS